MIAENIENIRIRMVNAAKRVGRDPASVTLVAVTKKVGVDQAVKAIDSGVSDLGESRIQEARRKFEAIGGKARWHMIGPLQVNKAKYCPGLFTLIHSVDRLDLASELSRRVGDQAPLDCLLQVNISGEEQKSGCKPENAADILKAASKEKGIRMKGLMTIPPYNADPEGSRPVYRALIALREDLKKIGIENVSLDIVSAGMTNDFEIAIEEGATIVRVGTAIFGAREK